MHPFVYVAHANFAFNRNALNRIKSTGISFFTDECHGCILNHMARHIASQACRLPHLILPGRSLLSNLSLPTKRMGFQSVSKASDARSLLDCVALSTPSNPARIIDQPSTRDGNNAENTVQLKNNPVLMPWVGFGTYRLGQRQSRSATYHALDAGYRNIDTAFIYGGQTTEIEVGKAINDAIQNGIIKVRGWFCSLVCPFQLFLFQQSRRYFDYSPLSSLKKTIYL